MSRAGKEAALLLGQVQGGQLVQRGEHDVDIHRTTLPSRHILTATTDKLVMRDPELPCRGLGGKGEGAVDDGEEDDACRRKQ